MLPSSTRGRATGVTPPSAGATAEAHQIVTPRTRFDEIRLPAAVWQARARAHRERADAMTAGWRARRATGERDEVEDFLFTYYSYRPSLLRRWHPGAGVVLEDAAGAPQAGWRWYRTDANGDVRVDVAGWLAHRGDAIDFIAGLLARTLARPPRLGCSCLHEWAMVYGLDQAQQRHTRLPLRLGHAETDRVVERSHIVCSHYDAFRFFTPAARPRNALQPTRAAQPELEQPGCLHANMDLYKWAMKLGPIVPGELLLDTFALARELRDLDMQASPYDVRQFGLEPVAVETVAGRREFAERQQAFADRANTLRRRMLDAVERARAVVGGVGQAVSTPMSAPTM